MEKKQSKMNRAALGAPPKPPEIDELDAQAQAQAAAERELHLQLLRERLGIKEQRKRITYPGGVLEFDLRILSINDRSDAETAAFQTLAERRADRESMTVTAWSELIERERVLALLWRACRAADTKEPLFESAAQLGQIATDSEIVALWRAYQDCEDEFDPLREAKPEAEA